MWEGVLLCCRRCLMGPSSVVSAFALLTFPLLCAPLCSPVLPPGLTLPEPPTVSVWGGSLCCGANLGDVGGWAAPFPLCVTPFPLCPHAFVCGDPFASWCTPLPVDHVWVTL